MAYDEGLAERVRNFLADCPGSSEKKMFGGLCFLINGNMCCGVVKDRLMVRVGPERYEEVLKRKHAAEMDFTGTPLKGFVYVLPEGLEEDEHLENWARLGRTYAESLPPKEK